MRRLLIVAVSASLCLAATADTKYWLGTSSALASAGANWTPSGAPTSVDDVVLNAGSANNPLTWDLNNGVRSWTQSDYTGTVTFQTGVNTTYSWDPSQCYGVDTGDSRHTLNFPITGNLTINSGTWTHKVNPKVSDSGKTYDFYKKGYGVYRLIVTVGGDCTIAAGAKMDVTSKGFQSANNYGPGLVSLNNGGSSANFSCHGGMPSSSSNAATLANTNGCYGSVVRPDTIGTARSSNAGGSVDLTVSGALTLNGSLVAESGTCANYSGSGGSVYVKCGSFAMGDAAVISANSGAVTGFGPGGGGRVAVIVETGTLSDATIARMTANAGPNGHAKSTAGTVYVQDATGAQLVIRGAKNSDTGVTPVRNPSELPATLKRISLEGAAYLFMERGLDLAIGEIAATKVSGGTTPRFRIYGGEIDLPQNAKFDGFTFSAYDNLTMTLANAGKLTVTNGAALYLNAPTTLNGSLEVFSSIRHSGQSSAAPAYTNRLDLTVTGNMTIKAGGEVDVGSVGYPAEAGPGGSSSAEYGGVYGGTVPGLDKNVYGSILHPTDLGSAGSVGGAPGAVKLTVGGTLTVEKDGWIRAYGNNNDGGSNASGGSVWLTVGEIAGSGRIDAKGGSYNGSTVRAAAGGSGGRIAVRQTVGNKTTGQCSIGFYYGGGSSKGGMSSGTGTLYWEKASDELDAGTVYSCNWLPPDGMPANELEKATIQVGDTATQNLLADLRVGDYKLPSGGTLNLNGHELRVLNPKSSYKKSVLGTVNKGPGGELVWRRHGTVIIVR